MNKKTGYHKIQDMFARFIHEILVCLTALMFRVRPVHVLHLPKGKSLYRYAQFSKKCMEGARKEDIPMYMERMYRMSYRLGRIVWSAAGLCGVRDKMGYAGHHRGVCQKRCGASKGLQGSPLRDGKRDGKRPARNRGRYKA